MATINSLVISLDVRIHDCHHLAAVRRYVGEHLQGSGEKLLVPREVSLSIGVLDILKETHTSHTNKQTGTKINMRNDKY